MVGCDQSTVESQLASSGLALASGTVPGGSARGTGGCEGRGVADPTRGAAAAALGSAGLSAFPALHYKPVIEALGGKAAKQVDYRRLEMTGGLPGRQPAAAALSSAPRGTAARQTLLSRHPPGSSGAALGPPRAPLPYRYRLCPCYGLCAGVGAWLLGVALCWCVEGHGVLRYCALPRVVLRGVGVRRRELCGDPVLGGRGVLGRGVGLSHRVRRSRGVLVTLPRQRRRPPYPALSPGCWAVPCPGEGSWTHSQPQAPQPHHAHAFSVSPPLLNLGLSLCRGSSWVPLPAAEPPASPAVMRWGSDSRLDQPPLNKGSCASPSPWGREPGQPLAWCRTWGNAEPAGNITLGGCTAPAPAGSKLVSQ